MTAGEAGFDVRVATMADDRSTGRRTLADKLNHLFETVPAPNGGRFSNNEVANAIGVSGTYIGQLKSGKRNNPTKRHMEDIAEFFGVDPAYFFDDSVTDQIDANLALLVRLRDAGVTNLAARLVGLPSDMREVADTFLKQLEAVQGRRNKPTTQPPGEEEVPPAGTAEPEADK
jgi:transcriptional regulator with XRE-family HTH domain